MAIAMHFGKTTTYDLHEYREKENRRPANMHHLSTNSGSSGSVPKRYQSVYTEGTPLTSFGVRNDENQLRSHSPSNHTQSQHQQRPLKPVKEFLTTHSTNDQHLDDRWRSNSQTTSYNRSHAETTVRNVNVALAKTLNTLRQEPLTNGHSTSSHIGSVTSRPMTSRSTSSHKNNLSSIVSKFSSQQTSKAKGPLPAELITRRATTSSTPSKPMNGTSHSRTNGPLTVQQSITAMPKEMKSVDTTQTQLRATAQSLDAVSHQLDGFNFNAVAIDEHPDKSGKSNAGFNHQSTTRSISQKQSPAPRAPNGDSQHYSLPEVIVNPHLQSSVQKPAEELPQMHESVQNGAVSDEKHTSHHHIQVEPTNTFKRLPLPVKHKTIADVLPNVIIQYQRSTSKSDSLPRIAQNSTDDSLNEAYLERNNRDSQLFTRRGTPTNENDSTSTLKHCINQNGRKKKLRTPPPSPATQELNLIWKKHKNKHSPRSSTESATNRKTMRSKRPPGRLKNYGDQSESETTTTTTTTETLSKDDDMTRRHGLLPSDLGSDVWSDLTSEFSDTKLRKHPGIRTSTPNMTQQSSSLSSKEVGQIRKQLTDLQIMYSDLLKLLDVDIESVRSSVKSSTSSQVVDHHPLPPSHHHPPSHRKHRFRKIVPVTSMRNSNYDMREINQRFTRLEGSVVTLAESIAKLSAQLQTQRTIKDDVHHLRQEVAELRQQIHHQIPRQQHPFMPIARAGTPSPISITSQQPTRLINVNVQRLAAVSSANPINISTSYMPSTSTVQRSNPIIDPRQARKIEQFFGKEAMLRYFLSLLDYEEYAPLLEREKIGIYELPYVSERKVQSLGIPYGPCARMIYEAQQYFISLLNMRSSGIDV